MNWPFDWNFLSRPDHDLAAQIVDKFRSPDLVIAPDGNPYIYRWHIVRTPEASVYFHIQVASDPERPLHDHPWDNHSVILFGGYDELYDRAPQYGMRPHTRKLQKGDTQWRRAEEAHRLILPKEFPYTMTLFATGPKRREWGFWFPEGWRPYHEVTQLKDGVSIHIDGGTY